MVDISTMSQDRVALTLEIVIRQQKESSEQLKKNIDALRQAELEYVKEIEKLDSTLHSDNDHLRQLDLQISELLTDEDIERQRQASYMDQIVYSHALLSAIFDIGNHEHDYPFTSRQLETDFANYGKRKNRYNLLFLNLSPPQTLEEGTSELS